MLVICTSSVLEHLAPSQYVHCRQMLADECRLHAALCAELKTDAVDEDLQAVQQLWAGVHMSARGTGSVRMSFRRSSHVC
jgi:hypothetical protein